jgi:flagellar basal-body rod protein FlgB
MNKMDSIMNLLKAGAKAEGMRQQAIAANVSNLHTPGYRTTEVQFEELLKKALASDGSLDLGKLSPELYHPENTLVKPNGNDVVWEVEVGKMVKNSLRHKTFIRLLSKKYQQIQLAIDVKG